MILGLGLICISCGVFESIDAEDAIPSSVSQFVLEENIEDMHEIREDFHSDEPYLLLFSVSFGPALDCPSGCFYQRIWGIQTTEKIGWMIDPLPDSIASSFTRYDIGVSEPALFDTSLLKQVRDSELGTLLYWQGLLGQLAQDKDTPSDILQFIAQELYSYISPGLCWDLLRNPKIRGEIETLCLMYSNPINKDNYVLSAVRDSLGGNSFQCQQ